MEVRYQLRHSPAAHWSDPVGNQGILANLTSSCEIG